MDAHAVRVSYAVFPFPVGVEPPVGEAVDDLGNTYDDVGGAAGESPFGAWLDGVLSFPIPPPQARSLTVRFGAGEEGSRCEVLIHLDRTPRPAGSLAPLRWTPDRSVPVVLERFASARLTESYEPFATLSLDTREIFAAAGLDFAAGWDMAVADATPVMLVLTPEGIELRSPPGSQLLPDDVLTAAYDAI